MNVLILAQGYPLPEVLRIADPIKTELPAIFRILVGSEDLRQALQLPRARIKAVTVELPPGRVGG